MVVDWIDASWEQVLPLTHTPLSSFLSPLSSLLFPLSSFLSPSSLLFFRSKKLFFSDCLISLFLSFSFSLSLFLSFSLSPLSSLSLSLYAGMITPEGHVNVSRLDKNKLIGPGGFIDITQSTRKVTERERGRGREERVSERGREGERRERERV
jgi:hypothetical protein